MKTLEIKDLHVSVEGKEILKGVSLTINPGEIHAIMGPNGSGKSTLSYVIAGHPKYTVTSGSIVYGGEDLLAMGADERARVGVFLAFQYPQMIQGLNTKHFLYQICKAKDSDVTPITFKAQLEKARAKLGIDVSFLQRDLNVGFSGGEKKRLETLQLLLSSPLLAVLDETDSGLDVDSLKVVCEGVNSLRSSAFSALVITHYPRILEYLKPDYVHVFSEGKIVKSGDASLAHEVEAKGYEVIA